ncbi:unnamed protein product [Toxocara canis]|uniref:Uncharacterized protein n=1 Tax=Toxocara canis TaxID=6265 RepID=A0A3P7GRC1_TOXCA|nr:unnamed protein product [Toxocara canis]
MRWDAIDDNLIRRALRAACASIDNPGAELLIGTGGTNPHMHARTRKIATWTELARYCHFDSLQRHPLTKKLAELQSICNLYRTVIGGVKPKRVGINKKVWLEGAQFADVERFLAEPAVLRGTGFQKGELAVARQLIAAEPIHTYLSKLFLKNIDTLHRWHPWCDLGYGAEEQVAKRAQLCEVMERATHGGCALGFDFQDFNACHPLTMMSRDNQLIIEIFGGLFRARGELKEAICDWERVGAWLSAAALNSQVKFEDRIEWFKVAVGMFGGIQDTNGTNKRMQVTEVTRAVAELRLCGVTMSAGRWPFLGLMLRGDDSIAVFGSMLHPGMYMAAFCGSGRPLGVSKQEISASGCEYLRCKASSQMVRGYLLRSLGTFLCAPFENADKWDGSGRCASLLEQAQLPLRRGANARALATIVEVTLGHWSRVEVGSEAGLEHIKILRVYLDTCEASGGLGCVLWPDQLQHTTGRLPALPTMHVQERNAANRVPARITTDLLWKQAESLDYDDSAARGEGCD